MSLRIETAEILSFSLRLPAAELNRLAAAASHELPLSLDEDAGETVLSAADSDSYLRFRPKGPDALLTEIFLCNDAGGRFFQRVITSLMVRHAGDLHARLLWTTGDRHRRGEATEVHIVKGRESEPTLTGSEKGATGEASASAEPPSAFDREVQESLAEAKAHWAEYQRLKAQKA